MSVHSQQQQQHQIMQACMRINQALQLPQQQFSLQSLTHLQWYITVLQLIYPQLQKQFNKIKLIKDQSVAFDKLLVMLANEEIIQQDFLQIKGSDIIEGDIQSVYYVVQLLTALIQRESQQQQEEEGEEHKDNNDGQQYQQQQQQQQQQSHEQIHSQIEHQQQQQQQDQQQQYQQSFQPEQPSPQQSPSKGIYYQQPQSKYPSQAVYSNSDSKQVGYGSQQHNIKQQQYTKQQPQQQFKNPFHHYQDSQDQQQQQEHHSVLGIQNQFQDQQQDEQQQEDQYNKGYQNQNIKRPIGGGMSDVGVYSLQNQQNTKQQQKPQPKQQQQNIFNPNTNTNKTNTNTNKNQQPPSNYNELISTNKPINNNNQILNKNNKQSQNKQKQFTSSSEQQQQDQSTKFNQNHHNNQQQQQPFPSKYNNNNQNLNKKQKQQSQSEDDNQYFINPTIKKYKSNQKLPTKSQLQSPSLIKKNNTHKKVLKYNSPSTGSTKIFLSKSPKKLVIHPTIKKQLRKATNTEAKKLTNQVKSHLASTLKKKKLKPKTQSLIVQNPTHQEMNRKRKQLKIKLTDYKQQKQIRNQQNLQSHTQNAKSNNQLGKILNWRQGQLKKEKQEFQKAMQLKLQLQKQNYIKKINNLLIKLQKQKQIHEQQNYKEKLFKQNHQAAKRLTSIEQWYKDRIQMLKQKNSNSRNQRTLMHTGHKEILKQIQKDLKRDNQKQIMAMTMKYRKQQAEIQNDIEELEKQIIKVYKRN